VRIVAVDWSGDATPAGQRERIWTAVVENDELVSLTNGRTREETVAHVLDLAVEEMATVVGFDFAFSLPAWYLRERGLATVGELWELAAQDGERWLRECQEPFWGRPGTRRPQVPDHFRRTDRAGEPVSGIRPKSGFQIGGAGAVGTGSIRGMPYLGQLRRAGFRIWPFEPPGWPLVVEIYPRALTGPVVKSSEADRRRYLSSLALPPAVASLAEASEDAFDAAVSALVMRKCRDEFTESVQTADPAILLEGEIWLPREGAASWIA
jgi:predicted nuclease with RNAse H fold